VRSVTNSGDNDEFIGAAKETKTENVTASFDSVDTGGLLT